MPIPFSLPLDAVIVRIRTNSGCTPPSTRITAIFCILCVLLKFYHLINFHSYVYILLTSGVLEHKWRASLKTILFLLTSNTEATENKVQFFNLAYRVKGFQCHSNNSLATA